MIFEQNDGLLFLNTRRANALRRACICREMNRKLTAIALAGITVGVIDGMAAVISSALKGVSPDRVFQYISSGILGNSSYQGGAATIALGVLLHFVVAFGAATAYIFAAAKIHTLNRSPLVFGPVYGIFVYFFMGEVVSALSNAAKLPRTLSGTIIGILIHIFCVGLPIALISAKCSVETAKS